MFTIFELALFLYRFELAFQIDRSCRSQFFALAINWRINQQSIYTIGSELCQSSLIRVVGFAPAFTYATSVDCSNPSVPLLMLILLQLVRLIGLEFVTWRLWEIDRRCWSVDLLCCCCCYWSGGTWNYDKSIDADRSIDRRCWSGVSCQSQQREKNRGSAPLKNCVSHTALVGLFIVKLVGSIVHG